MAGGLRYEGWGEENDRMEGGVRDSHAGWL